MYRVLLSVCILLYANQILHAAAEAKEEDQVHVRFARALEVQDYTSLSRICDERLLDKPAQIGKKLLDQDLTRCLLQTSDERVWNQVSCWQAQYTGESKINNKKRTLVFMYSYIYYFTLLSPVSSADQLSPTVQLAAALVGKKHKFEPAMWRSQLDEAAKLERYACDDNLVKLLSIPFASNHFELMQKWKKDAYLNKDEFVAFVDELSKIEEVWMSPFFFYNAFFVLRQKNEGKLPDDLMLNLLTKACQGGSRQAQIFLYENHTDYISGGGIYPEVQAIFQVKELVRKQESQHVIERYRAALQGDPHNGNIKFAIADYLAALPVLYEESVPEMICFLYQAHKSGHPRAAHKTWEILTQRPRLFSEHIREIILNSWAELKRERRAHKPLKRSKRKISLSDDDHKTLAWESLPNFLLQEAEKLAKMPDFRRLEQLEVGEVADTGSSSSTESAAKRSRIKK